MKKVLIIQRELPFYRIPLFEKLLNSKEFDFYLITGENDSVSGGKNVIKNEKALKIKNIKKNIKNFEFWYHKNLIKQIRKIKPDVIVLEGMISNISNWQIIFLKKIMKFKLIAWVCGYQNYTGKIKDFLLKKYFSFFDYCLAYHTKAKEFLLNYGFPREKIAVLNNAVKVNKKYNKKHIQKIKETYNLNDKKVILFVGRVKKSKKIELLLDSIKLLDKKYACLIVGGGDYLGFLKKKYKKQKNIIFTGEVIKGVEDYFQVADIFVLPGPGGLSLNEALYHGLPIISSLADGSAEDLVINNYNGFLLKKVTPNKIAEKIKEIFDKGKENFAGNSLKLGEKYSFDNFVENYLKGIRCCITNGR